MPRPSCFCRLHIQLPHIMERDFDFNVVLVLDGWDLASESMKVFLQSVFDMPENVLYNGPTWWDDLNDKEDVPSVETFVIQRADTTNWQVMPVQIEPDTNPEARMNLTLVIKRDNRRKHNTLEWFFRSFAVELGGEYGFTTGWKYVF